MDEPVTVSGNGDREARRRSNRARVSGWTAAIADLPIRFEAAGGPHAAALRRYTDPWPAQDGTPPVAVLRYEPAGALRPPEALPDREVEGCGLWIDGAARWIATPSGLVGRADADEVVVAGPVTPALHGIAMMLLAHVLAAHDTYILHGAAFGPAGAAVLLAVGGSGRGKSTAAAAAWQLGWDVLGDDMVAVRGGRVTGVARPAAVPAEIVPALGLAARPHPGDRRDRWHVEPRRLSAGWRRPAGLIVVDHGQQPTAAVDDLPRDRALRALVAANVLAADPAVVRPWLGEAATIVSGGCVRLLHGRDPDRRLASAAAALAGMTGGSGGLAP